MKLRDILIWPAFMALIVTLGWLVVSGYRCQQRCLERGAVEAVDAPGGECRCIYSSCTKRVEILP